MKHMTQLFGKKALSIICVIAIILSAVSVSFGALATETNDVTHYVVNANTSPALPLFAGTKVDLDNVDVIFSGEEIATDSADITWALGADYGENLSLDSENVLTALKKGNTYKVIATAGEKTATLWVVVAEKGDAAWNLYSIDFDAYTEAYSKLNFEAKPLYAEKQPILNPDNSEPMEDSSGNELLSQCTDFIYRYDSSKKTYYVFPYQSGVWSYSGAEFTYDAKTGESTVPADVAFPEGWSSYMTPPNTNGIEKLFKLPHVMPYDLSAGLHTDPQVNSVSENRKGIMPFANPYLFDGWNMSELGYEPFHFYNTVNNAFANSAKGFFVLDNEITKSFSDFVINTNLNYNAYNPNQNQGLDAAKYLQIYARMPLTSNGVPSKDVLLPGTLKSYNSSGVVDELVNAVNFQSIGINAYKEGNTKYGYISRFDYSGNNAKTVSSVPYGSDPYNNTGKTPMKWDYLMKLNKQGSVSNVQAHTGVNVDLTIKYEGESAFVTSREDSTKTEIVFNDVLGDKGAIAIGMNSLSIEPQYDATAGTSISQWVNVHQFSIDLVNDITADNDGTEYPFYEKFEFIPIVDATVEESYVEGQNIFFNTLSDAISYLGENGGTVYIDGEYTVTDAKTDFAATVNIAEGKKLVLEGFEGSNNGNIINFGTSSEAISLKDCFYSDIEFKNLTVNRAKDWEGRNLNSNGKTIVFGEGLETNLAGYSLSQINGGVSNNIVINSGTYSGRHYIHRGNSVTQAGSNYNLTINGGEFTTDIYANIYSDNNHGKNDNEEVVGKTVYINGDVTLNINGGNFNNKNISTSRSGRAASSVHGIIRINVNAATDLGLIGLVAGVYNTTDTLDGTIAPYYNHIVARVDHRCSDSKINSQLTNIDKFADNDGKKYIAIANYSDMQHDITNSALGLDYALIVDGGEADVVFDGAGEEAEFKGFSFTPSDENRGKNVVVNEKVIIPDENGVYDLSEFEDTGIVIVTFQGDSEKNYVSYVGFGNDFDNSLEKLEDADATVNVVYMGGSITNGDGLENKDVSSWRARSAMWLESHFASKVQHFNVAVSSTGTNYGMYRTYNDVISKNPDILFIEFSINDSYDHVEAERSGAQLETIIREVKTASPDCDIIVVLTTDMSKVVDAMDGKLHPQAEAHEKIAKAYGIPIMYVGKALANELNPAVKTDAQVLEAEWAKYSGDSVHPNATGHDIYFKVIRTFLESVYSGNYTADNKNVDTTDDSTIVSKNLYDGNRIIVYGDKTVCAENANGLYSVDTSKTLENIDFTGFTFEDSEIAIIANNYTGYLNLKKGTKGTLSTTFSGTEFIVLGNFVVGDVLLYSIDGGEEQSLVFESQNRSPAILVKDIEKGDHTITISFDWENAGRTADLVIYAIGSRDASIATGFIRTEKITELDSYKDGAVPAKNGYLFAGWYESETAEKAMNAEEFAAAETAVAKFIPKAVLDIKWQIAKGENGTANLRLISTVDSLQYSGVRFTLKCEGRADMVLDSYTVYTGISGYVDGNTQNYAPTINSAVSKYFMTHIVSGIPVSYHNVDFTVTAAIITKDGMEVTGDPYTFKISEATDYNTMFGSTNQ